MTFRQLYDQTSGTYSYLLASRPGGDLHLVKELDLKLVKAMDTHLHADHITGLGALRDLTHCVTVMGEQTTADVVSMRLGTATILQSKGLRSMSSIPLATPTIPTVSSCGAPLTCEDLRLVH
jgi:sulfur dioxygenase